MAETGSRRERDSGLAPALLIAGIAAIFFATLHAGSAPDMNPGVEGAVTAGVFAPILALLHGLSFSEMLKTVAPIWLMQIIATFAVNGGVASGIGIGIGVEIGIEIGIELCVTGAAGILMNLLASRTPVAFAPAPQPSEAPRGQVFARAA